MAIGLATEQKVGVFSVIWHKVSGFLLHRKWVVNNSTVNLNKLKVDLEGLSKAQLRLVSELVEQMKKVNEEDKRAAISNHDQ